MIARLRKKFILITMGSVLLVLSILMGGINAANFLRMDQNAQQTLQLLAENEGVFPDAFRRAGQLSEAGDFSFSPNESSSGKRHRFTPETPFETRYFFVELDESGSLKSSNTGKIAAVSTAEAVDMANTLWKTGRSNGYLGNYKYLVQETDGGTRFLFLDCTRDLSFCKDFLSSSLLVSLGGVLAVLLLVMALSDRAIRPVAESYEKQKQFITNAGHEIKTPLTIIDSCAEVLELETGSTKWSTGIREQVKRLTSLTQSLVSLARMDEGRQTLSFAEFSISDAVSDALEPFELMSEHMQLRFHKEIEPQLSYRGNEQSIRQLCSILADNALKYALADSDIRFSLSHKGKKLIFTCENQADGLQAGDLSILFDRFYRGDPSRSQQKAGYGIGLSMAQAIVAAHGGKIEARSDDGVTLRITVRL